MTTLDTRAISPTAALLAYMRSFSDIPFAREVADAIGAEAAARALLSPSGVAPEDCLQNAPFAEARWKSLARAVCASGATQVLELASGLSFRGAALAESGGLRYVETDLPAVVELQRAVRARVPAVREAWERGGVESRAVDVLADGALDAVWAAFDPARPVAIVHEGLLGYFSLDEKATVATRLHGLLRGSGGVWITPDLHTREALEKQYRLDTKLHAAHAAIAQATARDFDKTAFEDDAHLHHFFGALGFVVEKRPQVDGTFTLASLARLGLPEDWVERNPPALWWLRVAPG